MDIDTVERKVSRLQTEVLELKAAVKPLQARIERQTLVIGVLKDMLLADGAAQARFLDRLREAAERKAEEALCRQCGKALNAKQSRCMYCGEARPVELF